MAEKKWRQGRNVGITIYKNDVCVGSVVNNKTAKELINDANGAASLREELRTCRNALREILENGGTRSADVARKALKLGSS